MRCRRRCRRSATSAARTARAAPPETPAHSPSGGSENGGKDGFPRVSRQCPTAQCTLGKASSSQGISAPSNRSEERRVGKDGVGKFRSRWSRNPSKNKKAFKNN